MRIRTKQVKKQDSKRTKRTENIVLDSQVERLLPHRVKVTVDSFGSLLSLANLNRHIRITGTSSVFSLQALSTHHWKKHMNTQNLNNLL